MQFVIIRIPFKVQQNLLFVLHFRYFQINPMQQMSSLIWSSIFYWRTEVGSRCSIQLYSEVSTAVTTFHLFFLNQDQAVFKYGTADNVFKYRTSMKQERYPGHKIQWGAHSSTPHLHDPESAYLNSVSYMSCLCHALILALLLFQYICQCPKENVSFISNFKYIKKIFFRRDTFYTLA